MINGKIKIHINDNEYGLAVNDSFYIGMLKTEDNNLALPINCFGDITGDFNEGVIVCPKRHLQQV